MGRPIQQVFGESEFISSHEGLPILQRCVLNLLVRL